MMSVETKTNLTPHTISSLQELIQINVDSRDGYRHAADATNDLTLQSMFVQIALDRDAQAGELGQFVAWNGEYPREQGSISAAILRAWMSIREALSSDDRLAVLSEMEAGEDAIMSAYKSALENLGGSPINDVLMRQYGAVSNTHDRIRDLRDDCRCEP